MPRAFRSALFAACVLALPLAGCDDTPGASDPFGSPPSITAFSLTPEAIDDASTGETVEVTPTIAVTVSGGTGEVTVRAFVRDVDGVALLAEAEASGAAGRFELRPTLQIPRGAIGDYQITVTAEDASGRIGDRASGVLAFSSASLGAPAITGTVSTPQTVSRPASGQATVAIVADVTDPDGLDNLARVELREPTSVGGAVLFRFVDDGSGGDAAAGDGQYTIRLGIGSGTPAGTYLFEAVALDRSGLESAPAEVTFTVQ